MGKVPTCIGDHIQSGSPSSMAQSARCAQSPSVMRAMPHVQLFAATGGTQSSIMSVLCKPRGVGIYAHLFVNHCSFKLLMLHLRAQFRLGSIYAPARLHAPAQRSRGLHCVNASRILHQRPCDHIDILTSKLLNQENSKKL